jgi:hypothetical protein
MSATASQADALYGDLPGHTRSITGYAGHEKSIPVLACNPACVLLLRQRPRRQILTADDFSTQALEVLEMNNPHHSPLVDCEAVHYPYSAALDAALAWLGDRHLLARTVRRKAPVIPADLWLASPPLRGRSFDVPALLRRQSE